MILIKNIQIIDGSGSEAYKADILIDKNRISAVGVFPDKKAEEVVDGLGLTAVPGFIDVNTDSDHYLSLFTYPSQKDFLLQGVTTIIGGQCGTSLAPLMYGSLKSVRKWTNPDQVNVGWNTIAEFFEVLRKLRLGVNFATYAGHSTIRRDIVGEEIRDLTQSELDVFTKVLEQAMEHGAVGLSVGLGYIHGRTTPYAELKKMVSLAVKHNRVYAVHLRDEKQNLTSSIEETLMLAKETGARTVISHFRPIRGFEKQFENSVAFVEKNLVNANVYFDVNTFDASLVPIYTLLPAWAQNGGLEVMLDNLENANTRQEIAEEVGRLNLSEYVIAEARSQEYAIGKTLEQLAQDWQKDPAEAVLELMTKNGLRVMLSHRNLDTNLLWNTVFHSRSLIGSNGASLPLKGPGLKLERSTFTFPKFLELAASYQVSMGRAIKKITWDAAQVFGIKNRGLIKEGYAADLVLLKEGKIVNDVLVNGKFAVRNTEFAGELAGDVIKII